jgi:hypothetical protein
MYVLITSRIERAPHVAISRQTDAANGLALGGVSYHALYTAGYGILGPAYNNMVFEIWMDF